MKYIAQFFLLIAVAVGMVGCEEYEVNTFEQEDSFVFIERSSFGIYDTDVDSLEIQIGIAGLKGEEVEVEFSIDTLGFGSSGAVEGVNYEIVSPKDNKVIVEEGVGFGKIVIKPLVNDSDLLTNSFNIRLVANSADYPMDVDGKNDAVVDIFEENPISIILGDYNLDYTSAFLGPQSIGQEIKQVGESGTEVEIALGGYLDGYTFARGSVDLEAKTLSIPFGQVTYNKGAYVMTLYGVDANGPIFEGTLVGDIDLTTGDIVFRGPFAIVITSGPGTGNPQDIYIDPLFLKE